MAFNTSDFILAGTAIAIGGVGLYIWDTRGSKLVSSYSSTPSPSPSPSSTYQSAGKSRKHHRKNHMSKTKRH